jgi:hypothetical protein
VNKASLNDIGESTGSLELWIALKRPTVPRSKEGEGRYENDEVARGRI